MHRGGGGFRGPPGGFAKPENALKRAEELEAVGQSHAALQALHDVITSKRHRTWAKILETVMFKYVDLCVELKKGRYAKDGLIHYRNVCQQVNVASLEEVIKYFVETATKRAEDAKASAESTDLATGDLEAVTPTPEDLMLGFVSSEKGKDRTDRELVTPWFKFLWETYRTILDILRNNSRLESLYAMTAGKAFKFCLTYKRTTEFRRLCDTLRNHLTNLNKYREQRDRPDLSLPETQQLYLETRFDQLKTACDLQLWQEAFRSVEDIQGLMTLSVKPPKPQLMAVYYARLTRIFAVSGAHLYNGYAWYKLLNLARSYNKNVTTADVSGMASCVLLAALSIPPYDRSAAATTDAQAEVERERSARMASILGFSQDTNRATGSQLSRSALLTELQGKGVLNIIPQPVKDVFAALEGEFDPLQLCTRLGPLLDALPGLTATLSSAAPVEEADVGSHVAALKRVAIVKTLNQLSQVYSVMRLDALTRVIPFASISEIEGIIVDAVRHGYLAVRMDHRAGTLRFGAPGLDSDRMRDHIAVMARRLQQAQRMYSPAVDPTLEEHRLKLVAVAAEVATRDNGRALARKDLIEKRKEQAEQIALAKEQEEAKRRFMQQRLHDDVEEQRRKDEMLKRETERLQRELEEREMEEAMALVKASKGGKGVKLKEGEKLDKEALMREAISGQMKERQELERKVHSQARKADHLERARREEEAPLLQAAYEERLEADKVRHSVDTEAKARAHRAAWEAAIEEKKRLSRMQTEEGKFRSAIVARRTEEFEALRTARLERIAEKKQMMIEERAYKRKKEYARRIRIEIEDQRRDAEAAEVARIAEQEAREEAERQRKMQEAAKAAAEKERLIKEEEDRMIAERRKKLMENAPTPASERKDGSASTTTESSGWKPRERDVKEDAQPASGGGGGSSGGAWRPSRARPDAPGPRPGPTGGGGWGKTAPSAGPPDARVDRDAPKQQAASGTWQASNRTSGNRSDPPPNPPRPTRGGSRW